MFLGLINLFQNHTKPFSPLRMSYKDLKDGLLINLYLFQLT